MPRRTSHRSPVARSRQQLAGAAALVVAVAGLTACSDADAQDAALSDAQGASIVTGPLCAALPQGDDPGNPASLVDLPVAEALTWIPVGTRFESAMRETGMVDDLAGQGDVTLLVPTDDAFVEHFSEDDWDALMTTDMDRLRDFLEAHIIEGEHDLAALAESGSVTTADGTSLEVSGEVPELLLGEYAETLCSDYQAAGARFHVIGHVLGDLPVTQDGEDHHHG